MSPNFRRRSLLALLAAALVVPGLLGGAPTSIQPAPITAEEAAPLNGASDACTDFRFDLFPFFEDLFNLELLELEIADEGWVPVDPNQRFQSASGVVTRSKIAFNDTPGNHWSHDQNTDILVDPGLEYLVSDVNKNNPDDPRPHDQIEMEWEIGTFPDETGKNAPERYFPKWAWPNTGDRVWVNGHWVFDCGHPTEIDGQNHYRSEIHPARAIASMRDQLHTLPGTGTTPVRVTATDLYIHGDAGYITEMLYCGMIIVLDGDRCDRKTTPIADDYVFDMLLPEKPFPGAILAYSLDDGPGNTLAVEPTLEPIPAENPTAIRVTVPLAGSNAQDTDIYARRIRAGWIAPPTGLQHLSVTLDQMDLHEDRELDPGDCECTFFWLNLDRAGGQEWIRLSDYATGNMNDYDDDGGLGDGEMNFEDAIFDFYVSDAHDLNIRATGYDQDCMDTWFDTTGLSELTYLDCYATLGPLSFNHGQNDPFTEFIARAQAPDYGFEGVSGECKLLDASPIQYDCSNQDPDSQYELEFTLAGIPLTNEDDADLAVTKTCDDQVLSGEPFTCVIAVENNGPGLPAAFTVEDQLITSVSPDDYSVGPPSVTIFGPGNTSADATDCFDTAAGFSCTISTVPVGGRAEIEVEILSEKGGTFINTALVNIFGGDLDPSNDEASDTVTVVQVVEIDIRPGDETNPVKVNPVGGGGRIPVAILSTPDLDAPSRVDVDSLTFGRTGTEVSLEMCAKNPEDVNDDGLPDLICQFSNDPRLFQDGDSEGILRGQTLDGPPILIEGRDMVTPVP